MQSAPSSTCVWRNLAGLGVVGFSEYRYQGSEFKVSDLRFRLKSIYQDSELKAWDLKFRPSGSWPDRRRLGGGGVAGAGLISCRQFWVRPHLSKLYDLNSKLS